MTGWCDKDYRFTITGEIKTNFETGRRSKMATCNFCGRKFKLAGIKLHQDFKHRQEN